MKYRFIIVLAAFSLLFGSCSDEWLNDVEPQQATNTAGFYQNETELAMAMVAIYNGLKNQYWKGSWASWYLIGSMPSDDAVPHGGGRIDRPELWTIHDYLTTPSTAGLILSWERCYYGIYRANVILDVADPETPVGASAIAEAKALRAYLYFDLVRNFGENIPLITAVLGPDEYNNPAAANQEIFNQMVQDLTDAIDESAFPAAWTGADKYRMNKWAAKALLGKIYMYMASPYFNYGTNYYTDAATILKDVIDNSEYALEPEFNDVWGYWNEFNNETLFEISYGLTDPADRWSDGADGTGNVVQQLVGPRNLLPFYVVKATDTWATVPAGDTIFSAQQGDVFNSGWGFDQPTHSLVAEYRAQGDSVRLHGTAMAEWQFNALGYDVGDKFDAYTGYYCYKRLTWKELNPTGAFWGYGNNERVLRLADVYLLYAEAMERTGNNAEAISAANTVRSRVGLGSIEDVMTAQGLDLYAAIKLERRLELAMECNRFYDLVRWGDDEDVLIPFSNDPINDVQGTYEHKFRHYPIPQEEVDANTAIDQYGHW